MQPGRPNRRLGETAFLAGITVPGGLLHRSSSPACVGCSRCRGRGSMTTIRVPGIAPAPDLVRREWNPTAANRLWVADITFTRTWEGWLYLAAVLDCHSRRCVGWSLRDNLRAELVVDAVQMTIARRRAGPGLVHHSDHGSQYVSLAMGEHMRDAGIDASMGSKGSALDNAVIESFFATLKRELVTATRGPQRPMRGWRSSSGSRSSTTASGCTQRSGTPPRRSMRISPNQERKLLRSPNGNVSTETGQAQSVGSEGPGGNRSSERTKNVTGPEDLAIN